MKVYLVKVNEYEDNVDCVCLTQELAERERKRLAEAYGIDENDECLQCIEMDVIEE